MAKLPIIHPYSDQAAFDRLLVLIATLVKHPGVGSRRAKVTQDQDSLDELQAHMQQVAVDLGMQLPLYSVHTLRKDLVTLRDYGLLERHRHDWGYYLGSGALNREELQFALNALASQATYQGDAQARRIYQTLQQRLKCLNLDSHGELFYPVRAHFNRAIVHTDPDEMMRKQQNQNTLFHELETLEAAIRQGLPIEIYLYRNNYEGTPSYRHVYPLQLLYYDIAWYLVMEDQANGHLALSRMDRLKAHVHPLDTVGRGLAAQQKSLQMAHQLLRQGWGLNLGNPEEQQRERQGDLTLTTVKVRFFPPASLFIQEGQQRHPKQKIVAGPTDSQTGEPAFVDYVIQLPERSLQEFGHWVSRHMDNAQVLSPPDMVERHRQAAIRLVERYSLGTTKQ